MGRAGASCRPSSATCRSGDRHAASGEVSRQSATKVNRLKERSDSAAWLQASRYMCGRKSVAAAIGKKSQQLAVTASPQIRPRLKRSQSHVSAGLESSKSVGYRLIAVIGHGEA